MNVFGSGALGKCRRIIADDRDRGDLRRRGPKVLFRTLILTAASTGVPEANRLVIDGEGPVASPSFHNQIPVSQLSSF